MWSRVALVAHTCVRPYAKKPFKTLHDPLEHATGIEKRELLAHIAGNCDPFHILAIKRGCGTRERPTLVPSIGSQRLVGCCCTPLATPNWFWLHDREPKRCECGYWCELYPVTPL